MRANSMTITLARVARHIQQHYGGSIGKDDLMIVFSEYGVNQQAALYRDKMLVWGYLRYDRSATNYNDPNAKVYRLTDESQQTATITIRVPRLLAGETYRDLVGRYAGFDGILEIEEAKVDE